MLPSRCSPLLWKGGLVQWDRCPRTPGCRGILTAQSSLCFLGLPEGFWRWAAPAGPAGAWGGLGLSTSARRGSLGCCVPIPWVISTHPRCFSGPAEKKLGQKLLGLFSSFVQTTKRSIQLDSAQVAPGLCLTPALVAPQPVGLLPHPHEPLPVNASGFHPLYFWHLGSSQPRFLLAHPCFSYIVLRILIVYRKKGKSCFFSWPQEREH